MNRVHTTWFHAFFDPKFWISMIENEKNLVCLVVFSSKQFEWYSKFLKNREYSKCGIRENLWWSAHKLYNNNFPYQDICCSKFVWKLQLFKWSCHLQDATILISLGVSGPVGDRAKLSICAIFANSRFLLFHCTCYRVFHGKL